MNTRFAMCVASMAMMLAATGLVAQTPAVRLADSLSDAGEWAPSVDALRAVLATDSLDGQSRFRLALALFNTRAFAESAAEDSIVAARDPRWRPNALYQRARALAQLHRVDESLATLEAALDAGLLNTRQIATDAALAPVRDTPRYLAIARRVFGPYYSGRPADRDGAPTRAQMAEGARYLVRTLRSRHPDPYRSIPPAAWDTLERNVLARLQYSSEAGYLVELMRVTSRLGDVHTSAFPGAGARVMREALPVAFWKFPDGLRVRAADSAHASLLGARVVAFGHAATDTLWPRLLRDFPFENEWMASVELGFLLRFPDFLRGRGNLGEREAGSLQLRLVDGRDTTVVLPLRARGYESESQESRGLLVPRGWIEAGPNEQPQWLRDRGANYVFHLRPDRGALVLSFTVPRDDPARPWLPFLDSLAATIERERVERVVVDLRNNAGGWGPMSIQLTQRLLGIPRVTQPGHLFVLTSRITQSAGVVIAADLENHANAVFVGEPLGAHPNLFNGRQGNHVPQSLPGTGIVFRTSEVREQYSHALDPRRAIAPDFPVPLTWEAFATGRDEVLETALSVPFDVASRALAEGGGRPLEPYFRWQRPSQFVVWGASSGGIVP